MLPSLIGIIASSGGAAAGGDFESIATVTVGSGGSSTISFTSIPSTYQHLQIRGIAQTVTTGPLYMKMNLNSDTASNYSFHELAADGAAVYSSAGAPATFMVAADGLYSTPGFGATVIDLLDYANTNKNKTLRSLTGQDNNGTGYVFFNSSLWRSTSAITSISLTLSAGNFAQYTQFALYGIKG